MWTLKNFLKGGTTGQILSKRTDAPQDFEWVDPSSGSGDVTKDELAGATLVTSIGDTEHLPISVAGTPNSIKKIVWTAFKTILDGIYALTGHNHDSAYVAKNTAITGATKTKITYDTKGLVTAGADATQDDIGDGSTYKQYSSTEKSKLSGIEASADVTDIGNVSSSINGASAATPVDADKFPFVDADDNTIKTVTGANLKTYIGASGGFDIHALTAATIADSDEVPFWDATDSTNKKSTFLNAWYEIAKKIYPIGCIYTTTSSTNPGTTFGFGTWSQFGSGRVLIGQTSSDTDFDTAEETGGNKTINLQHDHTIPATGVNLGPGAFPMIMLTNTVTGTALSTAQNIMNPYIVVYFWKRTA